MGSPFLYLKEMALFPNLQKYIDSFRQRLVELFPPIFLRIILPLNSILDSHLHIKEAIKWKDPDGTVRSYSQFTDTEFARLDHFYKRYASKKAALPALPELAFISDNGSSSALTFLSEDVAKDYFLAYVAQSIVAESFSRVDWATDTFDEESLAFLFDSRKLFVWDGDKNAYNRAMSVSGHFTPGDPYRIYKFLKDRGLIKNTRIETISALINWSKSMVHFIGAGNIDGANNHWQYPGLPPVETVLNGSTRVSDGLFKSWSMGCYGYTGFSHAVLRTVNIPVKAVWPAGHYHPHYTADHLLLTHGDDPYNAMMRDESMPANELFVSEGQFNIWFDSSLTYDERLSSVGRRVREMAIEYLPNYLLKKHCEDLAAGLDG